MPRFFSILSGLFILVILSSLALAGIPKLINYQGMLTDNSSNPLNGTYSISFKIYNAESDGTEKWEETQSSVSVTNGLFNVILGSVTPIDLDFSEDYWLDISVEGEQMPSRLKFTSVGYAYRAKIADSAMVAISAPTGGGWTYNGSVVRLTTGTDNVGIGTENPQAKLHISGGYVRLDYGGNIILLQENGYTSEIQKKGNNLWLCNYATGYINFGTSISAGGAAYARLHISNDGKVGIGTITPADDLHVANHIRVGEDDTYPTVYGEIKHDGGGTGFIINANAGGGGWADLHFQTNGTTKMFLESGGNVGIGTTSPSTKLAVYGLSPTASYNNVKVNTATGDFYYQGSSKRYKDDIQPLKDDFDRILQVKPKSFIDKSSGQREIGYIAEEFDGMGLSNLVIYDKEGQPDGLKYELVSLYLLEVVKELKAKNEELQQRIESLEGK